MKRFKRLVATILTLAMIASVSFVAKPVKAASHPTSAEIQGKWYLQYVEEDVVDYWDPDIFEMFSNGKFYRYNPTDTKAFQKSCKNSCDTYTYDEKTGMLIFKMKKEFASQTEEDLTQKWRFEQTATAGLYKVYSDKETKPTFFASKNYKQLASQFSKIYKKSIEYLKTKVDKKGFYIKKGTLIRYLGKKKTVKIPKKVKKIADGAFEIVPGYKPKAKTVIVPGTCKTIKKNAFIFSGLKVLKMKEGVKKIEKYALSNTYWKKVYFPKSVKKIGRDIMATEEGLRNTKIYVKYNSKAHKYFKKSKNQPYGTYKLKFQ